MGKIDLNNKIMSGRVLLFVISNNVYYDSLGEIMKVVPQKFKSICYISLNKPHNILAEAFRRIGIDVSRIFFIDAVSREPASNVKVMLISSPKSLMELDTGIEEIMTGSDAECFVFDSLSTLLIYGDSLTLTKFVHEITLKLRKKNVCIIFTCLDKDISTNLINDITMFADEVVYIKRIEDVI